MQPPIPSGFIIDHVVIYLQQQSLRVKAWAISSVVV